MPKERFGIDQEQGEVIHALLYLSALVFLQAAAVLRSMTGLSVLKIYP